MFRVAAIGAGIGMGVDALMRRRKPVQNGSPSRLQVTPVVVPGIRGIRVSLFLWSTNLGAIARIPSS